VRGAKAKKPPLGCKGDNTAQDLASHRARSASAKTPIKLPLLAKEKEREREPIMCMCALTPHRAHVCKTHKVHLLNKRATHVIRPVKFR